MRVKLLVSIAAAALLAAACATGPAVVTSQVSTEVAHAPGADLLHQARYRFGPTRQRNGQPAIEKLQAMAESALARVGAVHDEAGARVGVQVDATVSAYWLDDSAVGLSNPRIALGIGTGWRHGGVGFGLGWPLGWSPSVPLYQSEVSLVMRDLRSGQIVYSTRARHDGPETHTDRILEALFVAALEGYPTPQQELRQVQVPLLPVATEPEPAAEKQ